MKAKDLPTLENTIVNCHPWVVPLGTSHLDFPGPIKL
jgi:hypothetical protein